MQPFSWHQHWCPNKNYLFQKFQTLICFNSAICFFNCSISSKYFLEKSSLSPLGEGSSKSSAESLLECCLGSSFESEVWLSTKLSDFFQECQKQNYKNATLACLASSSTSLSKSSASVSKPVNSLIFVEGPSPLHKNYCKVKHKRLFLIFEIFAVKCEFELAHIALGNLHIQSDGFGAFLLFIDNGAQIKFNLAEGFGFFVYRLLMGICKN